MWEGISAGANCFQAGAGSAHLSRRESVAARCLISERQALRSSAKNLIAIIDDDHSVRDALSVYLESWGHSTATFATAERYLSSGVAVSNACLISDVQLPGMQGPDLQVRLIADGYRIPIIFITGFYNENTRARVLRAGAIGYLAKPWHEASLIECLDRALGTVVSPL
jgi:FixJ family two-component response regulator